MGKITRTSCLLLLTSSAWAAAEPAINGRLLDAIQCRADPIGLVYEVVEGGSQFDQGYAVHSLSSELDWKDIIVVEKPLELLGASAHAVVGGPSASEENFAGLVYAKFKGDYHPLLKALALAPAAKDQAQIGTFQKALDTDTDGAPAEVCPMVIGLTPLEDGEFLLGCGWCNG